MIRTEDLGAYGTIVGYGIGQNYEQIKDRLEGRITFSYLADKRWENSDTHEYDGIPVISLQELKKLKNTLVMLFPEFKTVRDVIARELGDSGPDICYIHDLFSTEYVISSRDLVRRLPEKEYQDEFHNSILFDETIPENITIFFYGKNNTVKIGRSLSVNHLDIHSGNNAFCTIGDHTSIQQAGFWVSDARLEMGRDCMLSSGIVIRTHDDHHIFDRSSHKRVNIPKDVKVGNQVWLGYETVLLAGAQIGTGSVAGARTVTSSRFGDHVLLAGCPARVIREDVCWSRDNTGFFQRGSLEECEDRTALEYMWDSDVTGRRL